MENKTPTKKNEELIKFVKDEIAFFDSLYLGGYVPSRKRKIEERKAFLKVMLKGLEGETEWIR